MKMVLLGKYTIIYLFILKRPSRSNSYTINQYLYNLALAVAKYHKIHLKL